jgi:mono/diheme cytochrome c family protein
MKAHRANGHHLWMVVGAGITVLLGLPASGLGEAKNDAKTMYTRYCSSCHGVDGKGDGPMAEVLKKRPTDLTRIAKNAGGDFPAMKVMQSIDGTLAVRGHGSAEMPVWGERLSAEAAAPMAPHAAKDRSAQTPTIEDRLTARGKILVITEYLRSIQVK